MWSWDTPGVCRKSHSATITSTWRQTSRYSSHLSLATQAALGLREGGYVSLASYFSSKVSLISDSVFLATLLCFMRCACRARSPFSPFNKGMTGDCGFGSDGALSRIVTPSSSLEQRSVSLIKAQRVGSSHVVNDLPTDLDELLWLESVLLLEAENRFGGAEPNADVWPDQGCTFVELS